MSHGIFLMIAAMVVATSIAGCAAREARGGRTPVPRPAFEVSASLYAWELHDEGVESCLDNLQQLAAVNSVYLVALMHPEARPHKSERFPHNPMRERWMPEDSRSYWHPDATLYGRIRPQASRHAWLADTDWIDTLCAAARRRGMRTGAEISHTYIGADLLDRPGNEDLIQRTIDGRPVSVIGTSPFPCPNHPDVQAYLQAVFTDLAQNHDVDFVQTCMLLFGWGDMDQAGCFCSACAARAALDGIDLPALARSLQADPRAAGQLAVWRDFRRRCAAENYARISAAVHAVRPDMELRLNHHSETLDVWADGLLPLVLPHVDAIRISDYAEQKPGTEAMAGKRAWLTRIRSQIPASMPLIAGLGIRPDATRESIHAGIATAVACGIQGLSLGHYDGATLASLRAVREGLVTSGVPGIVPAIGFDLASLPGNTRKRRLVRDQSGVAALDVWHAELTFAATAGRYSLHLCCVDQPGGQAVIRVLRNGDEVGVVRLDDDTDCWQVRSVPNLLLHPGDRVWLEGRRDREDWAIADHVYFLRTGPP